MRGFTSRLTRTRSTAPVDGPLRRRLDDLADMVARELDLGALAAAWDRTRRLEQQLDPAAAPAPAEPVPPAPVIGRRFAAAHRRMLFEPSVVDLTQAGVRTHPAA